MDAIWAGFVDAKALIGLLAVATVGVVMAGIGVKIGLKWLVNAMGGGGGGGRDGMDAYNNRGGL